MTLPEQKPSWLRIKVPAGSNENRIITKVKARALCTVCVEAQCPNQLECFNRGTATFMLLGPHCTRRCTFCAVGKKDVLPPNPNEPETIADAVAQMGINYCVLTMVTRDDLFDGGSDHIARTVAAIRKQNPKTAVELLISDLAGNTDALNRIIALKPAVINHNIETVERLYPAVRPQADYQRSLALLAHVANVGDPIVTKSGIMVGLGENRDEVLATMDDILASGCQLLTIGQYLAPSNRHYPVQRYVSPTEFDDYQQKALEKGFVGVFSAPLVRSSYRAQTLYRMVVGFKQEEKPV
jgi:lipoic acid synthetase